MQRILTKRFWLFMSIIVGIAIIGLISMVVSNQNGKISADAAEKWTLYGDSRLQVNISDGVEEVKAGDLLNYKIDFSYNDQQVTSQAEMNQIILSLLDRYQIKANPEDLRLKIIGYLATGKILLTSDILANTYYKSYGLNGQIGTVNWLLKYPNFEMILNQVKPNSSVTLNIPAEVPRYINFENQTVRGAVYVYLYNYRSSWMNPVLVAKAVDEDKLISGTAALVKPTPTPKTGTTATPTPTSTPTPSATISSLKITPSSPGINLSGNTVVFSGNNIYFSAYATYSDGTTKEITASPQIKWEVITTKTGQWQKIGTITNFGLFRTITGTTTLPGTSEKGATGYIKATFGEKSAQTNEFTVMPMTSVF